MRLSLDKEVRVDQLARELSDKLGREVAISVRQPGERPGALVLTDAETGNPILDRAADVKTVRKVVADHHPTAPGRTPSREEQLVSDLEEAATLEDVKAALVTYHSSAVERQAAARAMRSTR